MVPFNGFLSKIGNELAPKMLPNDHNFVLFVPYLYYFVG